MLLEAACSALKTLQKPLSFMPQAQETKRPACLIMRAPLNIHLAASTRFDAALSLAT